MTTVLVWQAWNTLQCKCLHTLRGHQQPVQRIAICGTRLYSTAGRNIMVWDVNSFERLQVIKTQQDCGALLAMTAAPNGTVYVGGQVAIACVCPPAVLLQHICTLCLHCIARCNTKLSLMCRMPLPVCAWQTFRAVLAFMLALCNHLGVLSCMVPFCLCRT